MFVALYMLSLLFFLYLHARTNLFAYPASKPEPVSIIVPCYNAEKSIGGVIASLQKLNYPKDMIEIIVVDDRSKDNSTEVVRQHMRRDSRIRLIVNSRNSGGAAEPTNIGIKHAKHGYIVVADDDSTPEPEALRKMMGFIQQDRKVAAVTCSVLAKGSKTFMQRLQEIEYVIIAWNRKLLDSVDSVYVTPGPFALYRKAALLQVGLFDTKNMTQDIEIVWRLMSHGYVARMCLAAQVHSETPRTLRAWFKQRVRWNIGGAQTLIKYRKTVFRKGMLGAFIIPFFSISLFLGLVGLGLFVYLMGKRLLVSYLSTKYSLAANSSLIHLQDLSFSPSVLNFFGLALFVFGLAFTLFGLGAMRQNQLRRRNLLNIMFYLLVYLAIYPIIMVTAVYKLIRGTYSW